MYGLIGFKFNLNSQEEIKGERNIQKSIIKNSEDDSKFSNRRFGKRT